MAIHHSTKTKAEKLGIVLSEITADGTELDHFPDAGSFQAGTVQAHWPEHNYYTFGAGDKPANTALVEMEALQSIKSKFVDAVVINDKDDPFLVRVFLDNKRELTVDLEPTTPSDAWLLAKDSKHVWKPTTVPTDGGAAHKAGFPIVDNPYSEDDDNEDYARWDEEWEASADEADAEDDGVITGSVVKPEYRARYAEAGHPTHCGDWLAVTLNNLVQGKTATDLERFEAICAENGVDTSKYKRDGVGWQGRIRMTGRNLLAKRVFANEGLLKLPEGMFPDVANPLKADADWMKAQRFKSMKVKPEEEKPAKAKNKGKGK